MIDGFARERCEGYQFKRWRGAFLIPADFFFAFSGVDVLPMGLSADIAHERLVALLHSQFSRSDRDGCADTGQQERIVTSISVPSAPLREARRQKNLKAVPAPPVCVLDPDGDLVRRLRETAKAKPFAGWSCYHTRTGYFFACRAGGGHRRTGPLRNARSMMTK